MTDVDVSVHHRHGADSPRTRAALDPMAPPSARRLAVSDAGSKCTKALVAPRFAAAVAVTGGDGRLDLLTRLSPRIVVGAPACGMRPIDHQRRSPFGVGGRE